jgi:hypothetical protein
LDKRKKSLTLITADLVMKKRDYGIDLSALIMTFIGFYPPAPSAYEPAASDYEREARIQAVHARVQGVLKVFFGCGRWPQYDPGHRKLCVLGVKKCIIRERNKKVFVLNKEAIS